MDKHTEVIALSVVQTRSVKITALYLTLYWNSHIFSAAINRQSKITSQYGANILGKIRIAFTRITITSPTFMTSYSVHTSGHFRSFFREPHLTFARRRTAATVFFLFRIALWLIQTGYCPCSSFSVRRLYFRDWESSLSIRDASPNTRIHT